MQDQVGVVIIGAGSAGLSALRQVQKQTDDYLIVDPGPLGTKCARTGCMPSKALMRVARDFHRRAVFGRSGIVGAESLTCSIPAVLRYVRTRRDEFSGHMVDTTRSKAGDHLIQATARILGPDRVRVGDAEVRTGAIIIATGALPFVPDSWQPFRDRVITSECIFEQDDLPPRMAVVGLGPIGLELGQALCRLGIEVTGFDMLETVGGLTDPGISAKAVEVIGGEFPLYLGDRVEVRQTGDGAALWVGSGDRGAEVDGILAAMGTRPNVKELGLENLGVELDERGLPQVNSSTMRVGDLPVYMAGDCNGSVPLLHETADEGFIAGRNAPPQQHLEYCRRTALRIVFCDPEIAVVGKARGELSDESIVTGTASYEDQGRALIEERNAGTLRLYVHKESGRLLGAEMVAPEAGSLVHILALAIAQEMTVARVLEMPFFHPTLEEGLETALQDAASRLGDAYVPADLRLCDSSPEEIVM